jgi:hypothetical protein
MTATRFYLPSKRQLSYRNFNVDEFEERIRSGGLDAMRVLYWNYDRKRFQWDDGATCLVAFDEREIFLDESGLNDEPEADEVAEALPFFCESVRECSLMTWDEYDENFGGRDNVPFYWIKPDIKHRLAESAARFLSGCGVRFDAADFFDNLGRNDLIDADALDELDKLDEPHRFGGVFGYKFQRAKYEKIIASVTGRRFIVRGDFNDACFDENKVRAAAEVLRERLDEVDKYAEFWMLNDSQRGKAIIAGHVYRLFGYSGVMLASF